MPTRGPAESHAIAGHAGARHAPQLIRVLGMITPHDAALAVAFSERCAAARAHLRRQMETLGLRERDGWKIVETVRQAGGGSEVVMRPLHLHLASPDGLECVVRIDGDAHTIDGHCEPDGARL